MSRTAVQNVDLAFRGKDVSAGRAVGNVTNQVSQLSKAIQTQQPLMQRWGEDSQKTFEKFTATAVAGVAWTLSMTEMSKAIKGTTQAMAEQITPLEDLTGEWSRLDRELASIRDTVKDPEFQKLNLIEQGLVLVYRDINTELAEINGRLEVRKRLIAERNREQAAVNALIDEEAEAAEGIYSINQDVADKLSKLQSKWHNEEIRRIEERKNTYLAANRSMVEDTKKMFAQMDAETLGTSERQSHQMVELSNSVAASEAQAIDDIAARRIAAIERQDQAQLEWAQREDERLRNLQMIGYEVATSFASAFGSAFAAIAQGSGDAAKLMTMAIVDAAEKAVLSYAAAGAAASAAANAGIPGFGWIVAGAAAAATFGLIKGFLSEMPSYQHGGVVPGVDTGRDTVVAGLRPGERIFTPSENERIVRAIESSSGGGLSVSINTVLPMDSAQTTQQVRSLQFHQARLRRLGMA